MKTKDWAILFGWGLVLSILGLLFAAFLYVAWGG